VKRRLAFITAICQTQTRRTRQEMWFVEKVKVVLAEVEAWVELARQDLRCFDLGLTSTCLMSGSGDLSCRN